MRALLVFTAAAAAAVSAAAFRAAVVQNTPVFGSTDAETISLNLAAYAIAVNNASANGAQIVVLPEFGLGVNTSSCVSPQATTAFCEPVPYTVGVDSPCASPNATAPIQVQAACLAQTHNISVAINSCEALPEGNAAGLPAGNYNVELVYEGGSGRLLANYRKTHVWFTNCFLSPATAELVTFTLPLEPTNSSAGSLRLGIFTCFDILFSDPAAVLADTYGIKHFVYSAAIPLVGSAAQELWTGVHNATLFGSNLQEGESGIYVSGSRVTPVPSSGQHVLVADVL